MEGDEKTLEEELAEMLEGGSGEAEAISEEIQAAEETTSKEETVEVKTEAVVDESSAESGAVDDITAMRQQLEETSGKVLAPQETKTEAAPVVVGAEIDFLGDDDPIEVTADKDRFNKMLNKVYAQGRKDAIEGSLRAMPEVVKVSVQQQMELQTAVNSFYSDNSDLTGYKNLVGATCQDLASKNPEWGLGKLFTETEKEVRGKLRLVKQAKENTSPASPSKPAFAQTGRSQRGAQKPELSEMEREIAEMNATFQ